MLAEVGASHVWDTALSEISGGEFQRVLLARALLREPDLLILDEPAQAIDVNGQAALYEMIGTIRGPARLWGFLWCRTTCIM